MAIQADESAAYAAPEPVAHALVRSSTVGLRARRETDNRRLALREYVVKQGLLATALFMAAVVSVGGLHHSQPEWILCYGLFLLLFDSLPKHSRSRLRLDIVDETRDVILATALATIALLATRVLLTSDPSVATETLATWATTTIVLVPGRVAVSKLVVRSRRAGVAFLPTLIVGAGGVGQLTAKRLLQQPELGLRPVGFLDKDPFHVNGASSNLPVLGASWDLEEVARQHDIKHVIFAFSTAPHGVLLRMISRCNELGVSVSLVPRLFEKIPTRLSVDHVGGLPLISIHPSDPKGWQYRLKYNSDRILAAALLILAFPLLAVAAFAVWVSSGRPILYRQRRVGRDGQEFEILKFRSMHVDEAEEAMPFLPPDTAPGGVETSDRRTRIGKLMRRTSIDELPQLVNVIRGEMSLVGPRPERPEFATKFEVDVYRYGERVRVKSGITGWAQVNGLRGQTSLSDRVEWDNYYIENWSFWLDFKIVLLTTRILFRFAGG
jgi:exopolysaccharide biosynthesis polyprenyl glycosylphosphotransferase